MITGAERRLLDTLGETLASVQNFTLDIQLNGNINDPVTAIAEYDIVYSDLDRLANISYREVVRLKGDDTNVGDIGAGADDDLATFSDSVIETGGQQQLHRRFSRTISRAKANEDPSVLQPKDELRAEVRMTDVQGQVQPVFAESNLVEGRF